MKMRIETIIINNNTKVKIDEYNNITLINDNMIVAHIDNNGWFEIVGIYSKKMENAIRDFVKEYTPFDFKTVYNAYCKECLINIYTKDTMYI